MAKKDYYEVLGVSKTSTDQEIKKAFKSLARKYHPDVSKEDNAEEKFKEIQEAYAILSDSQKRQQYDQFGHAAFEGPQAGPGGAAGFEGFDFSDIFSEIFGSGFGGSSGFGGFGGRSDPNAPRKGRDVETTVQLNFKEAAFGTKRDITLNLEQECSTCNGVGAKDKSDVSTCSTCNGRGKVIQQQRSIMGIIQTEAACPECHGSGQKINNPCPTCKGSKREVKAKTFTVNFDAGVEHGAYMRLPQKGEAGINGGPNGDLFLNIVVKEDSFFKQHGLHLYTEVPVNYTQLTLGTTLEIPTIHGKVDLKIPHGTQSGSTLRLKGKGIHSKKGKGDQYVQVQLVVPKTLNSKEKKVLKELKSVEQDHSKQKDLFKKVAKDIK